MHVWTCSQLQVIGDECLICNQCLLFVFNLAAAPAAWHDLIQIKPWDGFGKRSIAESIALHSPVLCDNFANLLLKDHLLVKSLRRNNPGNDSLPFVQAVLEKWFYKSGSAVPCTWESLLECMKGAGLDGPMIELIRKHML